MLTVHKRGKRHADLLIGRIHAVRGSLGTRNEDAARRFKHKLEIALAEGCASSLWHELRTLLPRETFARFAVFVGVKEQPLPTWSDLRKVFTVFAEQRVKFGKLAESTVERYEHTFTEFEFFLSERKTTLLRDISVPLVEEFKIWRIDKDQKAEALSGCDRRGFGCGYTASHFRVGSKKRVDSKEPGSDGGQARRQSGRRRGAIYRE